MVVFGWLFLAPALLDAALRWLFFSVCELALFWKVIRICVVHAEESEG